MTYLPPSPPHTGDTFLSRTVQECVEDLPPKEVLELNINQEVLNRWKINNFWFVLHIGLQRASKQCPLTVEPPWFHSGYTILLTRMKFCWNVNCKPHRRHKIGIEWKVWRMLVGSWWVGVGLNQSAINFLNSKLSEQVYNVLVAWTGQHLWLHHGWKVLPTRVGYC